MRPGRARRRVQHPERLKASVRWSYGRSTRSIESIPVISPLFFLSDFFFFRFKFSYRRQRYRFGTNPLNNFLLAFFAALVRRFVSMLPNRSLRFATLRFASLRLGAARRVRVRELLPRKFKSAPHDQAAPIHVPRADDPAAANFPPAAGIRFERPADEF